MTTTELIKALRDVAAECEDIKRIRLCREAADRLEELDERQALMSCHWISCASGWRKTRQWIVTDAVRLLGVAKMMM